MRRRRWYDRPVNHYVGRFRVPRWVFNALPDWAHHAADWLGGVEPSPWAELRDKLRKRWKRES